MNIKKTIVTTGLSLLLAGSLAGAPMALADGNGYSPYNTGFGYGMPMSYSYNYLYNPLKLRETNQSLNVSYASAFNTSTSFAQQFQLSVTKSMDSLMQNFASMFGQGVNGYGFMPLGLSFGYPNYSTGSSQYGATQNQAQQFTALNGY
ncbi:MAG TPA: hypothetical protein VGT05_02740 [Patescibacteria group bacterium]|nr:hypothetical protein [Patescibacteria group bacterium]